MFQIRLVRSVSIDQQSTEGELQMRKFFLDNEQIALERWYRWRDNIL